VEFSRDIFREIAAELVAKALDWLWSGSGRGRVQFVTL